MKKIALAAALVLAATAAVWARNSYTLSDLVPDPENWTYQRVKVVRALDGDTVELEDGRKVRLLGCDAPEIQHNSSDTDMPGGQEAKAYTNAQMVGKTFRMYVNKTTPTDKYGRTLGLFFYWTGGSYNIDLIENTATEADYLWMKPNLNDGLFEGADNPQYGGAGGTINVNTADVGALDTLPGIGPSTAQAIIQYRAAHGDFSSMADLDAVPGIGATTLRNLEGKVSF